MERVEFQGLVSELWKLCTEKFFGAVTLKNYGKDDSKKATDFYITVTDDAWVDSGIISAAKKNFLLLLKKDQQKVMVKRILSPVAYWMSIWGQEKSQLPTDLPYQIDSLLF